MRPVSPRTIARGKSISAKWGDGLPVILRSRRHAPYLCGGPRHLKLKRMGSRRTESGFDLPPRRQRSQPAVQQSPLIIEDL